MARKKTAAKKPAKPATKPTRTAKKPRSKAPKHQNLPGMEGVRYARLDGICERIAEIRETLNAQRTMEGEECREALKEMHKHEIKTYRFAGVELARVPGEEKLRVRTSKNAATAETEDVIDQATMDAHETTGGTDPESDEGE